MEQSTATVQARWNKYLDLRNGELQSKAARWQLDGLACLEQITADARAGSIAALGEPLGPNHLASARYLSEERQAIKEYAKLAGLYVTRV